MERLVPIIIALLLSAFLVQFMSMSRTAPDLSGAVLCYLISAALACGIVLAVYGAITGKSPI
jgi:hypothetical protein